MSITLAVFIRGAFMAKKIQQSAVKIFAKYVNIGAKVQVCAKKLQKYKLEMRNEK